MKVIMATKIVLDDKEKEIVEEYLFRKAVRLKESGLEDSECYPVLMSVVHKLRKGDYVDE